MGFWEATSIGADLIVHVGHGPLVEKSPLPVVYVPLKIETDFSVADELAKLPHSRIGLLSIDYFLDLLPKTAQLLRELGKETLVGKPFHKLLKDGQVLGCDYGSALSVQDGVEAFLLLSSGEFHARGLLLHVTKPIFQLDFFEGRLKEYGPNARKRLLMERYAKIAKASEASCVGIIAGIKPGQKNLPLAESLYSKAKEAGVNSILLSADIVLSEPLLDFGCDAYVSVACPRLAIDGLPINKPILTPEEFLVVLGELEWESLYPQ